MFRKVSTLALTMAVPLSTCAIELTDYTNPDSFFQQAFVTGQFNMKSGNQDQTSFNGNALGDYEINYSTLPFVWGVIGDGRLEVNRGKEEDSSTEKSYDFFVRGAADKYIDPNGLLLGYGAMELGYRKAMGANSADDPFVKLGGGIGYGRVINATPLAEVLRFVEELNEYGLLNKGLSDNTYLELAAVVAKEEEYKSKHGLQDYKLYWIDDLEKVMQKAGILKNNTLGTVGVIKIQDVLINERISIRKHGWIAKGGVGYIASNYDGSDSDPSLDASFEYALPFSHEFQLIELARYSTILSGDITHHLSNRVSATYEVSDRIDWENVWDIDLLLPTEDNANDLITHNLSSSFRYYISNLIDTNVTLSFTKVDDDISGNGNDDVDTTLFFGIRYRLR